MDQAALRRASVVQDVFLSFARSAKDLKASGSLRSYLATCVLNRVRRNRRQRQRQDRRDAELRVSGEAAGPEQAVILADETAWRGSQDALARIHEKCVYQLLSVATGLPNDPHEAEDGVQDIRIVRQRRRRFPLSRPLEAYLATWGGNS